MARKPRAAAARRQQVRRAADKLLRAVVEHSADAVTLLDADGTVLYASPAVTRLLGYLPAERQGRPALELVHRDDVPRARQLLARLQEQPEVAVTADLRCRHQNGSYRVLEIIGINRLADAAVGALIVTYRDITDNRSLQAQLRSTEVRAAEGEEVLRAVFAASPECIKLVATDGTLLEMNPAGLAMLEADSLEQVHDRLVYDLVAPEHRGAFRALAERVFEGGTGTLAFEVVGLKGTRRWLETHAVPVDLPDEPQPVMLGISRDITERREAEEMLRDRENLYRALFENAPIGLGISDDQGNLLAFNDAIRQPGGYTSDDIRAIGNVARLYYDLADRDRARALARRDGRLHRYETRFRRKDGTPYEARMSLTPVAVGGKPCWLALVEDLTAQRLAEGARHTAEERYRAFIQQSSEAIFRVELEHPLPAGLPEDDQIEHWYRYGYLAECNDAMARTYGREIADDLVGRRLDQLLARSMSQNLEMLRKFIHSDYRLVDYESETVDREGRPKAFVYNLVGFVEGGMLRRIWGVLRDVTERRLLEEQLRQAQKLEAVGRLAGGVAHDFNNLLTAMLGSVELLLANLGPADPRLEDASDIKAAASRAAALTRQLLAFSRRQLLRPQLIEINAVVGDVQRLLRRLISEDVDLVMRLGDGLAPVRGDRGQLEQVLVNLVVNARDAMPDGGAVVIETGSAELDEAFTRRHAGAIAGHYPVLVVHDTGTGMDADTRAHLFEPFFTTKEAGKGTGLGLATVYGIVKQSGGYITVDSEPAQGTTFRIYLPVARPASPEEPVRVSLPSIPLDIPPDLKGGSETILIVEDEERIRVSARRILEHFGYRVLLAADGLDALNSLRQPGVRVDLVVSDVVMPRMSGPQLLDALRRENNEVRFLFTSGYVGKESRSRLLVDLSVPFLPKPWTVEELIQRVRSILDEAVPAA